MFYYSISHLTEYRYSDTVTASMMEVRLHPQVDQYQRVVEFDVRLSPKAKLITYQDYMHNFIHTFDIPKAHRKLAIKADSLLEVRPMPQVPAQLPESAWQALTNTQFDRDCYDMLQHSRFTVPTDASRQFFAELGIQRQADPLSTLQSINRALYNAIDYVQNVTEVDSHIDIAIANRKGVCQDYAHIMLAIVRDMGIPCRYVSGYLFHRLEDDDRSAQDASHAWVEAWLPELGWIGFDPTNNLICAERHIRVCIGRDYADAAPTKGVFTGDAETTLVVSVQVSRLESLPTQAEPAFTFALPDYDIQQQQQQ